MNDTTTSVETIVELENHIFIHPPDKKGTAVSHCFHCGKSAEKHRWRSPEPWRIIEKELNHPNRDRSD